MVLNSCSVIPMFSLFPRPAASISCGNVTWFNPPFSKSVLTNVGKTFLQLIDKHFPKEHKLNQIFNRSNTKVSYSCMGNMTNVIRRHNSKIQKPTATTPEKKCTCRKKDDCPLDGACLTNNLVYKAVVTAAGH